MTITFSTATIHRPIPSEWMTSQRHESNNGACTRAQCFEKMQREWGGKETAKINDREIKKYLRNQERLICAQEWKNLSPKKKHRSEADKKKSFNPLNPIHQMVRCEAKISLYEKKQTICKEKTEGAVERIKKLSLIHASNEEMQEAHHHLKTCKKLSLYAQKKIEKWEMEKEKYRPFFSI